MGGPLERQVAEVITPTLEHTGYRVVRVKLLEKDKRRTLQIMAERKDERGMTVDDCATISHTVSALLDVHDPISGAYHLEVSSPGIDRPLVSCEDFDRYAGFEAKLETALPIDGRKRYRGRLIGCIGDGVAILVDGVEYKVPVDAISNAKLVLTDDLIKAYEDKRVGH